MAEETPKSNQQPTGDLAPTTSGLVAHAKVYAEAAQTAAIKHGDNIKSKVTGTTGDILEATKNGVGQCVDKAQGYLNPDTATTSTEETPKSDKPTDDLAPKTSGLVAQAKQYAEAARSAAVKQGDNIKSAVVGTTGNMLEATKNGVGQCVDKVQGYLNTTTTAPDTTTAEETTKSEELAGDLAPTNSDIVSHAKVFAEAAQTAVAKQSDSISSKVTEASEDIVEAT